MLAGEPRTTGRLECCAPCAAPPVSSRSSLLLGLLGLALAAREPARSRSLPRPPTPPTPRTCAPPTDATLAIAILLAVAINAALIAPSSASAPAARPPPRRSAAAAASRVASGRCWRRSRSRSSSSASSSRQGPRPRGLGPDGLEAAALRFAQLGLEPPERRASSRSRSTSRASSGCGATSTRTGTFCYEELVVPVDTDRRARHRLDRRRPPLVGAGARRQVRRRPGRQHDLVQGRRGGRATRATPPSSRARPTRRCGHGSAWSAPTEYQAWLDAAGRPTSQRARRPPSRSSDRPSRRPRRPPMPTPRGARRRNEHARAHGRARPARGRHRRLPRRAPGLDRDRHHATTRWSGCSTSRRRSSFLVARGDRAGADAAAADRAREHDDRPHDLRPAAVGLRGDGGRPLRAAAGARPCSPTSSRSRSAPAASPSRASARCRTGSTSSAG